MPGEGRFGKESLMANVELEFFVHTPGARPQVIHAAPGDRLQDALVRAGVLQQDQDDIMVFVGECEDALHAPADAEDGADEHDPVDANLTLEKLAVFRTAACHSAWNPRDDEAWALYLASGIRVVGGTGRTGQCHRVI
jgi:hypothetical protein